MVITVIVILRRQKDTLRCFGAEFGGIRILAALRRSVVAVLTAIKGCHSLPLRSNPCLPKGKGHRWCLREDSMWDSNSRGTTPLGRRGSDSHQRLSFIAAPFESLFAKRKRTPMVFESRLLCGIRILAALRRSVVAVLTAIKGCHSLPLRSNPCLPKGKGHRWCLREDSMWDSNSRGTTPLGRRGSDSHQRLSFIAAPFESLFAKRKRTPMVFERRLYVGFEFSRHYAARSSRF